MNNNTVTVLRVWKNLCVLCVFAVQFLFLNRPLRLRRKGCKDKYAFPIGGTDEEITIMEMLNRYKMLNIAVIGESKWRTE